MWTRSDLKAKARVAFKANYWKSVFVALLISVLVGTAGAGIGGRASGGAGQSDADVSVSPTGVSVSTEDGGVSISANGVSVSDDEGWQLVSPTEVEEEIERDFGVDIERLSPQNLGFIRGIASIIILVGIVAAIIGVAIEALVVNPLEVGARRFFVHNLHQPANVREVLYAFDHGWWPSVKTLFLRDIKIIGWSLLLVVPGIVKAYEYRMIRYLLAEDPTMPTEVAFAESRRLMDGNKWATFVLDLSFLGWDLLSLVTAGAVGVFYAGPYRAQTDAALYEALRYGNGMPSFE